jgi:SAM-dependent methyltransferase
MTTTTRASMTAYTFHNHASEAEPQLASLEAFLDPLTTRLIRDLDLPKVADCWEIGAGGGSIAEFLATRVAPDGAVLATDTDTSRLGHLANHPNITVLEHDVTGTQPSGSDGFDLIHARLVLLHLPARAEILPRLAAALRPGGWLLIEEFDCAQPLRVLHAPSTPDADLFLRVTDAIIRVLERNGADMGWAWQVHSAMRQAGLLGVHTTNWSQSWPGGSQGISLHQTNSRQLQPQLIEAGLTEADLYRFRGLLDNPDLVTESYRVVSTLGRRPRP